ncbi:MAG: hypothetical protein KF753_23200 [Caldilineaceae bacterium]|nr:hypothetical protein [Caldilineaceae bacterium]
MRTPILKSILVGFVVLLLAACADSTPTAAPQSGATPLPATATVAPPTPTPGLPGATPQATATPEPTSEPTLEPTHTPALDASLPADWVAFTDEARGLMIPHPPVWEVMSPDGAALGKLLAEAEAGMANDGVQTILHQLNNTPGALDAFAALGFFFDDPTIADNHFVSNFTAIVTPADGLTLESYAELMGAQLDSVDGVTLHTGEVLGSLRPGGLDVASLRYSMDGPVVYGLPEGTQIDGWQLALHDTRGDRLLILTMTGTAENFPALEGMFRVLVANTQFE